MSGRPAVDREALTDQVDAVRRLMHTHAGGIEVEAVGDDGVVDIRFTGMCQGCPFRPVTLLGTIGPALRRVPGVTDVRAPGARVSEEAAERMLDALRRDGLAAPTLPAVPW